MLFLTFLQVVSLFTIFIILEIQVLLFFLYSISQPTINASLIYGLFRFFILSSFSSVFLLLGILPIINLPLLSFLTSSTFFFSSYNFLEIYQVESNIIFFICFLFGFLGFLIKLGAAPFHFFYHDIYVNLNLPSLFFITVPLKIPYYFSFFLYLKAYFTI
jgi:NADH:ubiquinone oxidoreductase subunit 2 (subunit N)